ATRVLTRAGSGCKDPGARARINADVGDLFMALGDPRKARMGYQSVLELGGDETAVLHAARRLDRITTEARDYRPLAQALGRLSEIEQDDEARVVVTERLARLAEGELKDAGGAIIAYKRLVGTRLEPEALRALERLLEATGAHEELSVVLRRRAGTEKDQNE